LNKEELLKSGAASVGVELNDKQIQQFIKYHEILVEWNSFMNLTGITEYEEVVQKHFVDSLVLCKAIDVNQIESLIDIGTGAGFPGIPLKIAYPHLKVTLLDSLQKRIKFLDEVIMQLGLTEVETIHGRAEDFAKPSMKRESYDVCVSRAVANLASLSEYCLPYVKVDGYFVPYKSGKIDEELSESKKAVFVLGGKIEDEVKFNLPDSDISRSLIKIKKISSTPKKYPRKSGLATKEPIK
jgi:16S rRNA (guanine527-N7)-methyltransferase